MHSSFETGDHLKTFGAALEPAPQGFEENEKMIEPLGENCHTVRGTCVVMVNLGGQTDRTSVTLEVGLETLTSGRRRRESHTIHHT